MRRGQFDFGFGLVIGMVWGEFPLPGKSISQSKELVRGPPELVHYFRL